MAETNVPPPPRETGGRADSPTTKSREAKKREAKEKAKRQSPEDVANKGITALTFALLPLILFGWLAWIIMLAGCAAVTKHARDNDIDVSANFGLSWLTLWFFFFILSLLTLMNIGGAISKKAKHIIAFSTRGMLFFLAILISWLGIDCHETLKKHNQTDDNNIIGELNNQLNNVYDKSRTDCLLAGEILVLIAAFLIALNLLAHDQAESASKMAKDRGHDKTSVGGLAEEAQREHGAAGDREHNVNVGTGTGTHGNGAGVGTGMSTAAPAGTYGTGTGTGTGTGNGTGMQQGVRYGEPTGAQRATAI